MRRGRFPGGEAPMRRSLGNNFTAVLFGGVKRGQAAAPLWALPVVERRVPLRVPERGFRGFSSGSRTGRSSSATAGWAR